MFHFIKLFLKKLIKPSNLDECITAIDNMLSTKSKNQILKLSETEFVGMSHFGLGMRIRNEWKLWEPNSKLFNYFNDLGLWHADDMSGLILRSYWRSKHNKPLEVEKQIKHFQDYWAKYDLTNKEAYIA